MRKKILIALVALMLALGLGVVVQSTMTSASAQTAAIGRVVIVNGGSVTFRAAKDNPGTVYNIAPGGSLGETGDNEEWIYNPAGYNLQVKVNGSWRCCAATSTGWHDVGAPGSTISYRIVRE